MDATEFEQLTAIMGAMAGGDRAAVFLLVADFGDHLANVLRRHLRAIGVLGIEPAELDGLVLDAADELQRVAAAWNPAARTLPWTWAHRRLAALVARHAGVFVEPLDPVLDEVIELELPGTSRDDDPD